MNHTITLNTVRYFKRIMRPLAEDGIIPLPEYHEAISQLTSLAEHGTLKPAVVPYMPSEPHGEGDMYMPSEPHGEGDIAVELWKKLEPGEK